MNCRIGGLHFVTKSPSAKKAMVLSSFFCCCIWMLCHISHSSSWSNHIETDLDGENGYVYMGRKELGAWPRDKGLSHSQRDGDGGSQENEGILNDDFHGNQSSKDQDAIFHDENGYVLGNFRVVGEDKDVGNELEMLHSITEVSSKSNDKSSEENSEVEEESHRNNPKLYVIATWKDQQENTEKTKLGRLTTENGEGNDRRNCEEENTVQETKMESNETVQGFQAFHDETGIQDFSRWQ